MYMEWWTRRHQDKAPPIWSGLGGNGSGGLGATCNFNNRLLIILVYFSCLISIFCFYMLESE